jgi:hypothetical protein
VREDKLQMRKKDKQSRVGVKFCGGCNPRYDRRAAYGRIRDEVAASAAEGGFEISFEPAREGVPYDSLLVIGGCANRCASVSVYDSGTPPVHVWNEDGTAAAVAALSGLPARDGGREKDTDQKDQKD